MNGLIGRKVMVKVRELVPEHSGYAKGEKYTVERSRVVLDTAYDSEEGWSLLLVDPDTGAFSDEFVDRERCRLLRRQGGREWESRG